MSINPIEGVSNAIEVRKVAPVERTNVKSSLPSEEAAAPVHEKEKVTAKSKDTLKEELEELNYKLKLSNNHCEFRYVEEANRVAIKVVDNDTEEVIKEIPSEEALKNIQALREMTGALVDHRL